MNVYILMIRCENTGIKVDTIGFSKAKHFQFNHSFKICFWTYSPSGTLDTSKNNYFGALD